MKALEINLQSLPPGESTFETEVPAEELDIREDQFLFRDPVRVALQVTKGETEVVFRGEIRAAVTVDCGRCLTRFEDLLCVPFSLNCHRVDAGSPLLGEGEGEEGIRFIRRDAVTVELLEEARSAVILSLPLNPLCREDCRGLCPHCGSDLNAGECGCAGETGDIRWKALEALRRTKRQAGA